MSISTIRAYFETKLSTWAATQSPALRIAYENVPFTPTTTETYLEAYVIPSITINPTVDAGKDREIGVFQVNVTAPGGKGMKALQDIVEAIKSLFPVVPKDSVVSVEQTPHISSPFTKSDGKVSIPVTVKYRLDS